MGSRHGSPLRGLTLRLRSRRYLVVDHSMEPTFLPGDRLLVLRLSREDPWPTVGDVVVVRDPEAPGRLLLKRVAATRSTGAETSGASRLLLDVRGDAAAVSRDSRAFGWVPADETVGRVWFRYAPPARRGTIPPDAAP